VAEEAPQVTVTVTGVDAATASAVFVNETLDAPGGTTTVCGTESAAGLELISVSDVPAAAAPTRYTVFTKLRPPATV
jgi:hypothetical protein